MAESIGYGGVQITEMQQPSWAAGAGHPAHVKGLNDFKVTKTGSLTVRVEGGTAYGYGITDRDFGPTDLTFDPAPGTTRLDCVVIRRDFSPANGGVTTVTKVAGGPTWYGGTEYTPGGRMDATVAVVKVVGSDIAAIVQAGVRSSTHLWCESADRLPYDVAVGCKADVAGGTWEFMPDDSGSMAWRRRITSDAGFRGYSLTDLGSAAAAPTGLLEGTSSGDLLTPVTFNSPYKSGPFALDVTVSVLVQIKTGGYAQLSAHVVTSGSTVTHGLGHAYQGAATGAATLTTKRITLLSKDGSPITLRPYMTIQSGYVHDYRTINGIDWATRLI